MAINVQTEQTTTALATELETARNQAGQPTFGTALIGTVIDPTNSPVVVEAIVPLYNGNGTYTGNTLAAGVGLLTPGGDPNPGASPTVLLQDNPNDTLNSDLYPTISSVVYADDRSMGTQNITGTNTSDVLNVYTENSVTINMTDVAADKVTVYGVLNTIEMNNAAGASTTLSNAEGPGVNGFNVVNMGSGANQVVTDQGTQNQINAGSGGNQRIVESGSGAQINEGNNILLATGAGTLVTNTGNNNTIREGSGQGQTIQSNFGTGDILVGGVGASQAVNDLGGANDSLTAGANSTAQIMTETGTTDTLTDAIGAANLQMTAASGHNTFNLGNATNETVNIGGGNNVVDIKAGSPTSTTSISGAAATDAFNFNVAQSAVHIQSQVVGAQDLTTVTYTSGPSAGQSVTILGTQTALNFTDGSVPITTGPAPTPSATLSTITDTPSTAPADGSTPIDVVVTVKDSTGAVIPNEIVSLTSTNTGDHFAAASGTTNSLGQFSTTLTSTTPDATDTISAAEGAAVETANVSFTPFVGPPTPTTINITEPSLSALANNIQPITLTATIDDQFGNPVAAGQTVTVQQSGHGTLVDGATLTTNSAGQVVEHIIDATPEVNTITFQDGVAVAGVHADFVAPGPDPAHSVVSINPTTILADGVQQGTVQVLVEDASGTPLAGQTIQLSSADAGDTLGSNTLVSNAQGIATTTISSITPGADVVTAVETSNNATETGNVTFTAPSAAATINIVGSPATIIGDNVDAATLTAQVLDQNNAPVAAGTPVTVTELIGSGTLSSATLTADSTGTVTETVTDAVPGDHNVLQFASGGATANATVDATTPEPAAGSTLTLSSASTPADGTTLVTVTATMLDAKGVPISGEQVNFASTGSGDSFAQTSVTTNATGVATTTLTSTTGGTDTITAAESNGATQTATETFIAPPAPSAANSTLATNDSQVAVDGVDKATLTLTVKDQNGAVMAGQAVTLASTGTGDHLSATTGTTDANGQVTVTLSSTTPNNDTVTATETSNGAQETAAVAFTQAATAANSAITAPATGVTGTPVNLSIVVKDASGNPIANTAVTLSSTNAGDAFGATTVTTNASGVATTTLTAAAAGADTITAKETYQSFTPTTGTPPAPTTVSETTSVNFTAVPVPTTINVTSANLNSVADNIANVVLAAQVLDQFGNPVAAGTQVTVSQSGHGTLSGATLTANALGVVSETVTDHTAESDAVTFTASTAHGSATAVFATPIATTMTATATPASVAADGITKSTISGVVDDQAGNPLAGTTVTAHATGSAALGSLSVVTDGTGKYTDTIVDHTIQSVTVSLADGSATASTSVNFISTHAPDASADYTSASLTTLLEGEGMTAAQAGALLGLIAPQGDDSQYPVELVNDSSTLLIPDATFLDAGGHTDQPTILDVLIANGTLNSNNFPNILGVVDEGGHLTITGNHSLTITGDDTNLLLADTGDDTVSLLNKNGDMATLGNSHGTSVSFGTGTGDIGFEGSGFGQSMAANGSGATLHFGSGFGQQLTVNGANSVIEGGTGVGDTATATASGDSLIAGTGVGDLYKATASGIHLQDASHGIASFQGAGDIFSLGHGELSSVSVSGGANTLGFASTAGAVVSVSGLQATDQLEFAAAQSAVHVTNLGNTALITGAAPGEVLALSFANAAAEQAAMAHAMWSHSV